MKKNGRCTMVRYLKDSKFRTKTARFERRAPWLAALGWTNGAFESPAFLLSKTCSLPHGGADCASWRPAASGER